ncbi:MAG TPA: hypothetical protein VK447_15390 [Myxococcaceae bacterium]|nr:hypothetical protein [Myxococcaceae bacterium]
MDGAPDDSFSVEPYSPDRLKRLFVEHSQASDAWVSHKLHCDVYFRRYFSKLDAKTILVEREYISRDYLEDFAAYYVKCFQEYRRTCTRLHFFNQAFTKNDVDALLLGDEGRLTEEWLQRSYLGFIVVKPLPQTIIGMTYLKTYPEEAGKSRSYPIVRQYEAHLFGMRLKVDSLAFQEQDRVVAACATSALWSAFQGTGRLFQHYIPTPVEITRYATRRTPSESRGIPNTGLESSQIAAAIEEVGLAPYAIQATHLETFQETAYGYLKSGIPIILIADLCEAKVSESGTVTRLYPVGRHAITLTGFGLGNRVPHEIFDEKSKRIDRVFAHDDQVGPFSRMDIVERRLPLIPGEAATRDWSLTSSWKPTREGATEVRFIPQHLIVPLYPKIRVRYEAVTKLAMRFGGYWGAFGGSPLTWDIHLVLGSDLKKEIVTQGQLKAQQRRSILQKPLPRYVWRAKALTRADEPLFDFIFDATDIDQGKLLLTVLEYSPPGSELHDVVRNLSELALKATANTELGPLFEYFVKSPRKGKPSPG